MQTPWHSYYAQLNKLFGQDPDIELEYDDTRKTITMLVENEEKADALAKILPFEKNFGGVILHIDIVPANKEPYGPDIIKTAFKGNPIFKGIVGKQDPQSPFSFSYCMFKNEVVQYWDDNLGDPSGLVSTLYEDIAREVLDKPNVFFCTDTI